MNFSLENVTHIYGSKTVLSIPRLEIRADGIIVIMGPSGSGKSTLVRLLGLVEVPAFGIVTVEIGSIKYSSISSERPWPALTCVFQKQFLWPHLSIEDNIKLPLRSRPKTSNASVFQGIVDKLGMGDFLHRYPNQVSGGQAQRAALARALVLEPSVILIDEPHNGLDLTQQDKINGQFVDLRCSGVSFVIVTHSLDFALRYADHIIIIEDGGLAEQGSIEIVKNPSSDFLSRAVATLGELRKVRDM